MSLPRGIRIHENSLLARIAAWKMGSRNMALVLGRTIHLYGVRKEEFLQDEAWVRHELKHVEQYRRMGILPFLVRYLWWSARYGYYNNPLEQEARRAERE